MEIVDIQKLAQRYGLTLTDQMHFNEMGIDFKVCFAKAETGENWVLRIPRRKGLGQQIASEKRILELVSKYLSVQVPDWQIASEELVAYPLLQGKPALIYDANTYEVTWNMNKDNEQYIPSLAKILVELHSIPEESVVVHELKNPSPDQVRNEIFERFKRVKSEMGIRKDLENRYRKWLDNDALWPNFTKFIHGDLYAGHVLTWPDGEVCGVIDWTTAQMGDIAQDFSGHLTVFGEESLITLITEYQKLGGQVWDTLFEQAVERAAAAPLAYGQFALETQYEAHLTAAKQQLS
jgi:macrolide phosphotransferase